MSEWEPSALTSLVLRALPWPHVVTRTPLTHSPFLQRLSLDLEDSVTQHAPDLHNVRTLELRGEGDDVAPWLQRATRTVHLSIELSDAQQEPGAPDPTKGFRRALLTTHFPQLRSLRTANVKFTPKEIARLRRVACPALTTLQTGSSF